jgi:hypothetical protein
VIPSPLSAKPLFPKPESCMLALSFISVTLLAIQYVKDLLSNEKNKGKSEKSSCRFLELLLPQKATASSFN